MDGRWTGKAGATRTCMAAASVLLVAAMAGPAAARPGQVEATIQIRPTSGPAGTLVAVRGSGWWPGNVCPITLRFEDANGTFSWFPSVGGPSFKTRVQIPPGASVGPGLVYAEQLKPVLGRCFFPITLLAATFTVTGQGRWLG